MVNWESQSKTPPRVWKTNTFIIFYSFVLHSVTCHFTACFKSLWTSISVFYVNTARDVVTVLLIFAKHFSLYLHIFTCIYRGTHTQAHMYNQHTRGILTTRHRSLVERGGRKAFARAKGLAHKKKGGKKNVSKNRYSPWRIKKKGFVHIELPAKLLAYVWRNNKSNINQSSE